MSSTELSYYRQLFIFNPKTVKNCSATSFLFLEGNLFIEECKSYTTCKLVRQLRKIVVGSLMRLVDVDGLKHVTCVDVRVPAVGHAIHALHILAILPSLNVLGLEEFGIPSRFGSPPIASVRGVSCHVTDLELDGVYAGCLGDSIVGLAHYELLQHVLIDSSAPVLCLLVKY